MTHPHLGRAVGDWEVDMDWDVYGADAAKIGSVDEVHPQFLVVGRGRVFHREYYVPVRAITNVERQCIYVNVSASEMNDLGWDRLPDIAGDDADLYDPPVGTVPGSIAAE